MITVAVLGAGSWGTAVARLLARQGHHVRLWARDPALADTITATHRNPAYLSDVELPATVVATADAHEALTGAQAVAVVTPSHAVRATAEMMRPYVEASTPIISLAKGIERGSDLRMTEVLAEVLGGPERLAALSGPNHAEEVSRDVPSATVVAAYDDRTARFFQDLFHAPSFRVYTNPDVVGVELCGASKNVIAVAAGISDGLGYGDNTKATLMTRGLAEMARLGRRLGADPLTYMGLAGIGDLIATCTSRHSRNRGLGEHVARGGTIETFAETTHMVAEGAISAIALHELGEKYGIELPITRQVRAILYEGASPRSAQDALMGRAATDEFHGMGLIDDEE